MTLRFGMSTRDLFSLILHSENEYFSSFNFSPFLASFLKGYVPVLRDPAQVIIRRYFEKQTCCKDIVWSTLRAGNRAASYDSPLGFSKQGKAPSGPGPHPVFSSRRLIPAALQNLLSSAQCWINLLFIWLHDASSIYFYPPACCRAARPIFSDPSLCSSTSRREALFSKTMWRHWKLFSPHKELWFLRSVSFQSAHIWSTTN